MIRFDATSAECLVFTRKAGMLAAVGHDLKLRVERFSVEVEAGAVEARFEADSLRVVCAIRDGRDDPAALSANDRRDIEAAIASAVLDVRRHPIIAFASTRSVPEGTGQRVEGSLTLRGRARPLSLLVARARDRAVAEARLHQPDFGIKPYSALLGALRVRPEVVVRLSTPWPPGA